MDVIEGKISLGAGVEGGEMTESQKLKLCEGCRNNFYNDGNNEIGVKRCWSFTKVTTLNCHHAPGQYAHYMNPEAK